MAWQIQLKFGIGAALPRGNLHRKFCVVLFREYQATDAWKWHFLYSCKIHSRLSHALFPWATRHTTVCLDLNEMCLYPRTFCSDKRTVLTWKCVVRHKRLGVELKSVLIRTNPQPLLFVHRLYAHVKYSIWFAQLLKKTHMHMWISQLFHTVNFPWATPTLQLGYFNLDITSVAFCWYRVEMTLG